MKKNLFELYTRSFPDYPITEERFSRITSTDGAQIIERKLGDSLAGFAVIRGNSISLLCVDEEYRRKGIGTSLLREAESIIRENGSKKITLGQGNGYIFQGVPEENSGAVEFFKHHGYSADWSSENMRLDLRGFDKSKLTIYPCPADVTFRLAKKSDHTELLSAVSEVDGNWVKYFENSDEPVLLAVRDGKIAGFEFLSTEDVKFVFEGEKTASIGCVGVIPSARRCGIGLQMVAEGLQRLKEQGCTSAELLYVELVEWYSQLGFETMHRQWMGEKII